MITVTPYDDVTWQRFQAKSGTETCTWAFGRSRKSHVWFLRDHEGCVRRLEATWVDSVPRIRQIAANYGFACAINTGGEA